MNINRKDLLLYGVTDRRWLGEKTLAQQVEEAVKGGVTCLQLREKELSREEFIRSAAEIKKITDKYGIPLIINDDIEVMLAVDADGVHVGQKDMEPRTVREKIGPRKILGVSARTPRQAREAEAAGADYLGCGAVFGTNTKGDASAISPEILAQVCGSVSIPTVAIGGVTAENAEKLAGTGIAGAAVVSGLFAQSDIGRAAEQLLEILERAVSR